MANKITRTIPVTVYTTGKFNPVTMTVTDMHNHRFPYKLGQRERRRLEKTIGAPIIAETTEEILYEMTLEKFLEYATPVNAKAGESIKDDGEANE